MANIVDLFAALNDGRADQTFQLLYGDQPQVLRRQRQRYATLLDQFSRQFPNHQQADFFSSPGRTEIGGNHTDHNAGRVLAAAVDLDILAVVARNNEDSIRIYSEGYPPLSLPLSDLARREEEKFTSAALVRGICARMAALGLRLGGFDALTISDVPTGSGLSSSAAYEVLVATILAHLYNQDQLDDLTKASLCQYSETQFFGKPSGLMDQTTCAVGGFVAIDFQDFSKPQVKKVAFDFSRQDYAIVIVNTGGSHADLNEDYAGVEREMKSVASAFGGSVLREFSLQKVLENIPFLRSKVNDRAILRAIHFFQDDDRVLQQVAALESNDFPRFLKLVNESGNSSWRFLQNCYSPARPSEQGLSLGLALTKQYLQGRGVCRVHGGGFAGTIQVYVPQVMLPAYLEKMDPVFGPQSCHPIRIRPLGSAHLAICE